jgi:hypothetical protein
MYTKFWSEKLMGKKPLGTCKCRWEDNIKIHFGEIGCGSVNWMHLAQERALVNMIVNLRVP